MEMSRITWEKVYSYKWRISKPEPMGTSSFQNWIDLENLKEAVEGKKKKDEDNTLAHN